MWEDVLKVQSLSSVQSVNTKDIVIPEDDKQNCREELIALYKKAESKFNSQGEENSHEIYGLNNIDEIPEEDCCAIIKFIKEYKPVWDFKNEADSNKLQNNEYKISESKWTPKGAMSIDVECYQSEPYNDNDFLSFSFIWEPVGIKRAGKVIIEGTQHFPNRHGTVPIISYSIYHKPGSISWITAFEFLDWRK